MRPRVVVRVIRVSRRHQQVLDLLAALDHATPELLARELELPVGLVELLLADLEVAGLVGREIVH